MPRISVLEFERLPLRVHAFLAGVPLHDVWAVDLPRIRPGITLDEFLRKGGPRPYRLSPVVRALLSIRLCIGSLLGWDRKPTKTWESFAKRLTTTDHSKSVVPASTREGDCTTLRFSFAFSRLNECYGDFSPVVFLMKDLDVGAPTRRGR